MRQKTQESQAWKRCRQLLKSKFGFQDGDLSELEDELDLMDEQLKPEEGTNE